MSHPGLDGPRIVSSIRQGVTAAMAEHVRVDREWHSGALAEASNERMEAFSRRRAAALGAEHIRSGRLLALQAA